MTKILKRVEDLLPDERLVAVHPRPAIDVDAKWRRQPSMFSGRALGAPVFAARSANRLGELAVFAGRHTAGIVQGFGSEMIRYAGAFHLAVEPGLGFDATGQDIFSQQRLRVPLSDLTIDEPLLPTLGDGDGNLPLDDRAAYIVVLQPVATYRAHLDEIEGVDSAWDPCEQDPTDFGFHPIDYVDGGFLRLLPVPADALAATTGVFRNELANILFGVELMLDRDLWPWWWGRGLPLGVLGFPGGGADPFFDAHTVARAGGRGTRRCSAVPHGGWPALWQARFEQFADHFADTTYEALEAGGLRAMCRWLPPVGTLPPGIVQVRADEGPSRQGVPPVAGLFPANVRVTALPVEHEALEDILTASVSMSPIDLEELEQIEVLVPVPSALYEPRLLWPEAEDPLFDQSERLYGWRYTDRRSRLEAADRTRRLLRIRTEARIPEPLPDPRAITSGPPDEGDKTAEDLRPFDERGTEPHRSEIETKLQDLIASWVDRLESDAIDRFSQKLDALPIDDQRDALTGVGIALPNATGGTIADRLLGTNFRGRGLQGFLLQMHDLADRADERLDLVFTRTRAALYRVRHELAGESETTRAAPSPVLTELAKGQFARPDGRTWREFATILENSDEPKEADPRDQPVGTSHTGVAALPLMSGVSVMAGAGGLAALIAASGASAASATSTGGGAGGLAGSSGAFPPSGAFGGAAVESLGGTGAGGDTASASVAAGTLLGVLGGITAGLTSTAAQPLLVAETIASLTQPKLSKADQVASIVETLTHRPPVSVFFDLDPKVRLQPPPAPERLAFAQDVKVEAYDFLTWLHEAGIDLDGLGIPGFVEWSDSPEGGGKRLRTPVLLSIAKIPDVLAKHRSGGPESPLDDGVRGTDEAALFASTVKSLEGAVASLRLAEQRIGIWREAIAEGERVLSELQSRWRSVLSLIRVLEEDVAEVEHDLDVLAALYQDELERIEAVNNRRRTTVENHVPYLVFRRPRSYSAGVTHPVLPLVPALPDDPLPACAEEHAAAPSQLRDMVELLDDAPVHWFTHIHPKLRQIDRLAPLVATLQASVVFAKTDLEPLGLSFAASVTSTGQFGPPLIATFERQREHLVALRAEQAKLDLFALEKKSWAGAITVAEKWLSLRDLLRGVHQLQELREAVAHEKASIFKIAACLSEAARQIPPATRLSWAERISVFDSAVDLQRLALLPGFVGVDIILRRRMQIMVDWLYGRVRSTQPRAMAYMHDLVRMALLLASHAPVNRIVEGTIVDDNRRVGLGDRMRVKIDPFWARVGMDVQLLNHARKPIARGRLRDVGTESSEVEILQAAAELVDVEHVLVADAEHGAKVTIANGATQSFGIGGFAGI